MNMRNGRLRVIGLSLAASFGLAMSGCGGSKEGVDTAQVTVSEPTATSSSAAPSTSGGATETKGAAKAPENKSAEAEPPASGAGEGWGTLKGKVTFAGDPPATKILVAKGQKENVTNPEVCSANAISSERLVVNPANKGVRWVIVYIPKPTRINKEAESAALSAPAIFDQKSCTFFPHVLAIMKGATVTITSQDSVGHNTNSRGFIKNVKFNLPTQPGQKIPVTLKYDEPRPAEIGCDIHGWMKAFWLVSNNPYFAVTDADGNYEIKNVPAGEQKVAVWGECLGPGMLTASSGDPIAIKAGGETTKDYTIDASKVKAE